MAGPSLVSRGATWSDVAAEVGGLDRVVAGQLGARARADDLTGLQDVCLVGRLQVEAPEKAFIGGCRLCPYMKLNSLEKLHDALAGDPRPDQVITIDEDVRARAARCLERMFELAPSAA